MTASVNRMTASSMKVIIGNMAEPVEVTPQSACKDIFRPASKYDEGRP